MGDYRISERDLVVPALEIMDGRPDGCVSTSDLIQELEDLFSPGGRDAEILEGRSDTYFSQKVRNMISHRHSPSSFIYKGYAEYDEDCRGLRITDKGRWLLQELGDN